MMSRGQKGEHMRFLKMVLFFGTVFVLLTLPLTPTAAAEELTPPKNIILFIGDGMGVGHITAAKIENEALNLEQFKTLGLLVTQATDTMVPDSSSTTTALTTGVNTIYGAVGINPEGKPLKNILEYSRELGKGTGLVVTSNLTDVTTACFVAHVPSRSMQSEIARALVDLKIDVIMGGGLSYFLPDNKGASASTDSRDLLAELGQTHTLITTPQEFRSLKSPLRLAALLDMGNLPPASSRPVSLKEMTQKAIEILSKNEQGFFLMIEGSQIDWAAHHGNGEQLIEEVIDLDRAVGAALDFAKDNKDTLVLVVADHESGGYTILNGSIKKKKVTQAAFFTEGHTAEMVPLFAYGPGSEIFAGIHETAFVGQMLIRFVQSSGASQEEK